jgi:hypothetical protein
MNLLLLILSIASLLSAIAFAAGKCPAWLTPLLLAFIACLTYFPRS